MSDNINPATSYARAFDPLTYDAVSAAWKVADSRMYSRDASFGDFPSFAGFTLQQPHELDYHHYNLSGSDEIAQLTTDRVLIAAKDPSGSKILQDRIGLNIEFRNKVISLILAPSTFLSIAKDSFGNFVIQKVVTSSLLSPNIYEESVFTIIEKNSLELSFNRYSCRVVQTCVKTASEPHVRRLLDSFKGKEGKVSTDQNANHIVQRIFDRFEPDVYASFVHGFITNPGIDTVIGDKYGCRVVQMCLEKIVAFCSNRQIDEERKKSAYNMLHIILEPILKDLMSFSENEYANYIVQYILRTDFLVLQRKYIIKNCILHNILWLSQGKFASHVVEQALKHADYESLCAMFSEILEGYESDERGRDALDIMLFDQFGNYVIQRLLIIAIDVAKGIRPGKLYWLKKLSARVNHRAGNLSRYSSGKKIIETLEGFERNFLRVQRLPYAVYNV